MKYFVPFSHRFRKPSDSAFPSHPRALPEGMSVSPPASASEFDFIIVGAGSSGCVLANRLSASGRHRVLLLEAGPRDDYKWIHIPMGYSRTMFHPEINWGFHTEPDPGIAGRKNYWPRGKVLGGCSAINGLLWVRGQSDDFRVWESLGNKGWGWDDVLPHFKATESYAGGDGRIRGRSGETGVEDGERHELVDAFIAGAEQSGIPRAVDYNGAVQEGAAYFQINKRRGIRSSTSIAFLRPAEARANLVIATGAHATRIGIVNGRATSLEYMQAGVKQTARARHEIILSAGTLQSPQLLQLSGLGPAALLQRHGIDVLKDLPGVGENMQDHLQIRLLFKCSRPVTNNDVVNSWSKRLSVRWQYFIRRAGPMASGINQGVLFTSTRPEETHRPDIEFHFGTTSSDEPGAKPHPWSGFTMSTCQLRPESKGRVQIGSVDPLAAPLIQPNYLSHPLDVETALRGVRLVRKVSQSPALSAYVKEEFQPGAAAQSDDELLTWVRERGATTIFHPAGTCKMGSDAMSVVDERLRVRGIGGLRVVDCSIMPIIVSGNTNAACIMIGDKAAKMILEDAG